MASNAILLTINGINNTGAAFAQIPGQARQAANDVTNAFNTVGNGLKAVGKSMTMAFTVPMTGIVASSVNTAMSFEQQMQKVSAISGAAGEELQDLTEKAKEMGAKTKFSATESAQAFEYMAMAGWKTQDMMNGIEGIMNLASASGEDLASVSDIVTDALTAFGMQASESGRFADILASASSNSNTNVAMMGETFKYVAPVMGALKMSAEDTAVAIGLMANAGIKGSQAGTSLRSAMTNMAKPTKQMQKAMDKLGLSMTDSKGNAKDLKTLMTELRYAFAGLTETEQVNYATTIFGKNAYAGMLAIINASEQDFNKLTSAVYSSSDGIGDAAEMSEVMLDSLSGQITILKSAWEGIQLKIADSVLPTIKKVVSIFQTLADKINAMNPKTLDMIVKIGLVVAAIGPMIWILGSLITNTIAIVKGVMAFANAVKILTTTFTLLKIAMVAAGGVSAIFNPWVWIIGLIIGLVIALTVICVKNWESIKKGWGDMCDWMGEKWSQFTEWIKPALTAMGDFFTEFFDNVKVGAEFIATPFIKAGQWIVDVFNKTNEFMKKLSLSIIAIAWYLGEAIITPIKEKIKETKDAVKKIIDVASSTIEKAKVILSARVESVILKIQEKLKPIVTFVKNIISNVKEVFQTGFNYVKNIISGIFDSVSKTFQKLKSFYGKVVEVLRPVMSIVENFKKGFETVMDKIVEIFTNIYLSYTAFTDKFRNFIADVKKDLTDFINSWINGINHLVNGLNQLDLHIPGVEELGIADIHWDINIPTIDNLPSLSVGTSEVLKDGLAVIHKGEAVVPAQVNPWRNDTVALNRDTQPIRIEVVEREQKDQNIIINLDSRQIANVINKRTRTDYLVRG